MQRSAIYRTMVVPKWRSTNRNGNVGSFSMIQIKQIVAFSHHGETRSLPLKLGAVNIISGESKSGKSAVLKIIDYCFGASHCDVPEGKVRRNVAWFGLLLQTSSGQAFIARQVPLGEAKYSEVVYTSIGAEVVIPTQTCCGKPPTLRDYGRNWLHGQVYPLIGTLLLMGKPEIIWSQQFVMLLHSVFSLRMRLLNRSGFSTEQMTETKHKR